MRGLTLSAILLCGAASLGMTGSSVCAQDAVVSVGGPITEIIFALEEQDRLIARDTTSVYPPEALGLPDVGYMRRLSAEGVLSVGPDMIIARDTSGPPEVLEQLQAASIPVVLVHDAFDPDAILSAIDTVGAALDVPAKAAELSATVQADLDALAERRAEITEKKRVIFVLSADAGRLNVAGRGTGADGLITMAGGINAVADGFDGYKLMNNEALLTANPDVVLMLAPRPGTDHSLTPADLQTHPGLLPTAAGAASAIRQVPAAALGFGPRTPALALALLEDMYGGAQ
ncbi:hemin ABC transporter substrate-binding protein [Donghicola sp. XS_ASV15]|uniref:heme/hemin ABC transporter substrate-binding protein n=1 Tax=Donghicola sp. XS_ASV15 TaxID=3241295 RepID=UPI003517B5ED